MLLIAGLKHCRRAALGAFILALSVLPANASSDSKLHIAFGDVPRIDLLNMLTALERARARGVAIEVSYLQSEDIAAQAIVTGRADIGVGTPYGLIQESRTPIRLIYQLSTLKFYPMVNTDYYQNWADLDGANMYTHSRGSGTEAIMNLMAKKHGIEYKSMTYLPGSAVRAAAMMQGRIRASIVDSERARLLLEQGGGKFAILPMPDLEASDEALYGNVELLRSKAEAVDILLEELVGVWREINRNPESIKGMRERFQLLPDLPAEDAERILPYYSDAVGSGIFPDNGGGARAAAADFEFYGSAGSIEGDVGRLEVEDFWYLEPLSRALDKLGRI